MLIRNKKKIKLSGRVVIDGVSYYDNEQDYELSCIRFRVGTTCIELTLHSYGFKFEAHSYEWVVSHLKHGKKIYDYHDFLLSSFPKYSLLLS